MAGSEVIGGLSLDGIEPSTPSCDSLGGQLCPFGALLHLRPEAAEPPGCGLGDP